MIRLLLALWLILAPTLGFAQTEATGTATPGDVATDAAELSAEVEDDRGFLTRFLERNLSDAGRRVVITGFDGALSSRATFDSITIADAEGVWIELLDGAIQWDRSALFGRRIEIEELSAREIRLPRLPAGERQARTPEIREFQLPTLPVSVNIARIAAERVELGEPVIGEEAAVSVAGSMQLGGGEGEAQLRIERVDGKTGVFALDAAFSNETRNLRLALTLDEARDGLFANLVDLYDKPALRAEISGEGPLSDFMADIRLATDGQDRVTGRASAHAQTGPDGTPGTGFRLELTGDVASLLPPDNRTFFGPESTLLAEGWRGQDGQLSLPVLLVDTEGLNLSGSLALNETGAPQSVVILLSLGEDAGATTLPVRLPLGREVTTVQSGSLQISYDAAQGDSWTARGRIGDLIRNGDRIGALTLDGSGSVVLADGDLEQVVGQIVFGADDLALADAGLQQALGRTINGETRFDLTPGNAMELTDLSVTGEGFGLFGTLLADGLRSGITISGEMDAGYEDLSRLSTLAGRPLTGQAAARLTGLYTVLSRGFDIEAEVHGTDITVDQEQLDRLLAEDSTITLSVRRDEDGIDLRDLTINAQRLIAQAQGLLTSEMADIRATLQLASLTDADPEMAGSLTAEAVLSGASGARRVAINGEATDLVLGISELDGALQGVTNLTVLAQQQDGAFQLQELRLANPQITVDGEGSLARGAVDARFDLAMPDISVLGRGWSGGLRAQATVTERDGTRHLDLTGTGNDLRLGQADVDGALTGVTQLRLQAAQRDGIITVETLELDNQQMSARAQGQIGENVTDLQGSVDIRSLAAFGRGWRGSLALTGSLADDGEGGRRLDVTGTGEDLSLGQEQADGVLAGTTRIAIRGVQQADGFVLEQGEIANERAEIRAEGRLGKGDTDLTGRLEIADLGDLGLGWGGSLQASGSFADDGSGARQLTVDGVGRDLRLGQANVDGVLDGETRLAVRATERDGVFSIDQAVIDNPKAQVTATGTVGARTDLQGRVDLRDLAALGLGWQGSFVADASLADDGDGARRLILDGTANDLSLGQANLDAALAGPTQVTLRGVDRDGILTIEDATVRNARLTADAQGTVGRGGTDLTATVQAETLEFLGRGIDGALAASGRLVDAGDGVRRITAEGTATGLSIGQDRIDPLLSGQTTFDLAATQDAGGVAVERLDVRNGQLRLSAQGDPGAGLTVDAALSDLGQVVPGLPGPATATGTIRQQGDSLVVDIAATAPGGTRAQISGTAARDGSSTDLRIAGVTDAAIANPFLRVRSIEGPVNFDLQMQGPPSTDALSGTIRLPGARLSDPRLGLRIDDLAATADLRNGVIDVAAAGNFQAGGRLTLAGTVDLRGGTPLLDLRTTLDGVVLRDPNLYETVADGAVTITGATADGPLIAGRIVLRETEFRIPSTGLGGARAIPDITHLGDRPPVRGTRAKAGLLPFPSADSRIAGLAGPPASPPQVAARLDLTIDAPNQVFVRGRGVDAELGGQIRLTGTARTVVPVGQLELIRGRVDLLGKRFTMTEGLIELQGDLVPVLRLVAETQQDGITTRIIIDGDLRSPDIRFESDPDLPEEEVLSQLLFGRGLDNISALQAAQLANAIAVLAGTGSEGIVSQLRGSVGLDDLDLTTDDNGEVSVRAGKYLSRNLYTDVEVDAEGTSQINLNLDVSDELTARGSVASDGESTLGLFYERDY
ncbi:translocation/assembly module TamB domain-containing protein [uncultured Paracoccus sp.]|uniref:translocation/assembly module TamB domain-containing protein n=1 Tax=uncultured Paracoccus sp. TaxID=189685 RepID=UPI002639F682|nr:translocation/assembly module TamB domain-containing protein [uncultured Paracoccus sp.]